MAFCGSKSVHASAGVAQWPSRQRFAVAEDPAFLLAQDLNRDKAADVVLLHPAEKLISIHQGVATHP